MRIAIISDRKLRTYLFDTFAKHPELGAEIACLPAWKAKDGERFRGVPICTLVDIKTWDCDTVLIAVSKSARVSAVLTWLHDNGVSGVFLLRPYAQVLQPDFIRDGEFDPLYVDRLPGAVDKPYLPHLEACVCRENNLNWKGDASFAPFAKGLGATGLDAFERDIKRLSELFSGVGEMVLKGGEPLLAPAACKGMIYICRKYFPRAELRLVTNGTLLDQMDEPFIDFLRENGVVVSVAIFPPTENRREEIEGFLQNKGIAYLISKEPVRFYFKTFTLLRDKDREKNNAKCGAAGAHFLTDGMVAKCAKSILAADMAEAAGCRPEELRTKDAVRLADADDGWTLLRKLDAPCDFCERCTTFADERLDWELVKGAPDPNDWLAKTARGRENEHLRKQMNYLLTGRIYPGNSRRVEQYGTEDKEGD